MNCPYNIEIYTIKLIPLRKLGGLMGLCFFRGYSTTPLSPFFKGDFMTPRNTFIDNEAHIVREDLK